MSWSKAVLVIGLIAAFGGCGFRPLYGNRSSDPDVLDQFAAIKIARIKDRAGQELRNDLMDLLTPRGRPGKPAYLLSVELSESITNLAVQRSGLPTRANLLMSASFSLRAIEGGATLLTDQASSVSSYNLLNSAYSTLVAEDFARSRAVAQIAQDIRTRLGLYFGGKRAPAAASSG